MSSVQEKPKALVLGGGGTNGFATLGAVARLQEAGILDDVDVFAGTSVGALIAALLLLDADLAAVRDCLLRAPCAFQVDFDNLLSSYSLDDGAGLRSMIEAHVGPSLTFGALKKRAGKTLLVCATCVNTKSAVYFSDDTHPDVPIALALRMSCSVPLVFACVPWRGHLYVDGMLVDNLPVCAAAERVAGPILAIQLGDETSTAVPDMQTYLYYLFLSCTARDQALPQGCSVIRVDVDVLSGLDFDIKPERAAALWAAGDAAATEFASSRSFSLCA